MKKIKYFGIGLLAINIFVSCSAEDLNPTQDSSIDPELIKTDTDARLVADAMYKSMRATAYYGRDFVIFDEVRSDNTFSSGSSGRFVTVGSMSLTNNDAYAGDTFSAIYKPIASANIVIAASLTGDAAAIAQVKGEAYGIRALCHFDLLKLFGQQFVSGQGGMNALGISYVKQFRSTDVYPARGTVAQNKADIYSDLDAAIANLSPALNDTDAIRLTSYAAHALKSRVALYFGDWQIAKDEANYVITNSGLSIVSSSTFVASFTPTGTISNKLFMLKALANDNNAINGLANIYRGNSYGDINVLQDLKNSFSALDVRGSAAMITIISGKLRNKGKYPTGSPNYNDNTIVMRYEEVVLNYAEALFRLNPTDPEALTVLNSITSKRSADPYTEVTEVNILLERRKELCFEGFRFSDLARTGKNIPLVSPTQQTHGGVNYGSYKYAFPIPIKEVNSNSSAIQNLGY